MMAMEDEQPLIYGALIEDYFGEKIQMIIDPGQYDFIGTSTTIIDFTSGAPEIIREGAGQVNFLG
jgi:tRNA A37 threonylcarbamoyladenosine synthetase subunit TsaC/SUA5/YrdC